MNLKFTTMGKSKGKRTSKTGLYWCNVVLQDGSYKLCVAELIKPELNLFRVWCNSNRVAIDSMFTKSEIRVGWFYADLFEEEINEFFNF